MNIATIVDEEGKVSREYGTVERDDLWATAPANQDIF